MEGEHGVKAALLGGWEIGTIFQASSGQALTVYTGSLGAGRGGPSGTGYPDNQRPNMATDGDCRASNPREPGADPRPRRLHRWSAFQLGTIGNEKRGQCRGPGFSQTDLAFYKTIRTGSKVQVQARFEIFNVFNHDQLPVAGSEPSLNRVEYTLDPTQTTIRRSRRPATSARRRACATHGRRSSGSRSCSSARSHEERRR